MPRANLLVVSDEFVVGYRPQQQWNWMIAMAFLLGKVGGGLFLVSLFVQFPLGMLLGWLVAVVGKGAVHMAYLGKPLRFWRAFAHPRTSWLSRGLWAMVAFAGCGLLTLAPYFKGLSWLALPVGSAGWAAIATVAVLGALVIMIYDGFVMSASRAMALWNTPLLPVIAFSYAVLGGVTFTVVFGVWSGDLAGAQFLELAELALFGLNFLILAFFVATMSTASVAARRAVQVLFKLHAVAFFVGVVAVGLMASALLVLWFTATHNGLLLVGVAVADMVGHYLLFYLLLKAGLFAPVLSRRSHL